MSEDNQRPEDISDAPFDEQQPLPDHAEGSSIEPPDSANQRDGGDLESGEPGPNDPLATPSRSIRPHGIETSRRLAAAAAKVALDNKGQNVIVLDVCSQSAEFDFFVLATGTSRRQLHAISEEIDDVLQKELGDRRLGIEGYEESRWIVLDYGSVVVHLFDDETREFYDLESLWADGQVIPLEELGLTQSPSAGAE